MKFYDASKPLYLEMDVPGMGLVLLQMWMDMKYRHDEVPDNVALYTVAFASKSVQHTAVVQLH